MLKSIQKIQFPKINRRQKRIILVSIGSLFVLMSVVLILVLSKREAMLDAMVKKAQAKLKNEYGLTLTMAEYGFSGLATVSFSGVHLVPDSAAQLAHIQDLKVSIRVWPLLFGDVKLGLIDLTDAKVSFVKQGEKSNYDFLFKKKNDKKITESKAERNLAETAEKIIKQIFFKIPKDMKLKDIEVSYQDSLINQTITMPEGIVDNGEYDVSIYLNKNEAKWNFQGRVDPDDQELSVLISSEVKGVKLPFLKSKYGLDVSFDEVRFELEDLNRISKSNLTLAGQWEAVNLVVNNWRLSDKDILIPHVQGVGAIVIGQSTVELKKDSKIKVKDFEFSPSIKYTHHPSKSIALAIHTGKFGAQQFFDAIPNGLFTSIEGLEVSGMCSFDLDFSLELDKPDDLKFSAFMDDSDLKIVRWGNANVSALNQQFVYKSYEDSVMKREIQVGPSNPNFRSLQSISPILRKTVLNTEDPFFYQHRGFEEEAFKLSLVTNIKERKFKRGASTISMQLVKNLFLTRNKTIMRKLEEILIVWLMESSKQVSKDRLFEIYLNVIEWGRNVYGINEAAQYYFGKSASELNLGESLYLSSIIPRPKTGLSSFDYTGHLKPWVQRHFNTYGYILNRRGQLQGEEVPESYGFYGVQLQAHLRPAKPAGIVDSTEMLQNWELEDMIKEIDQEEQRKRSLIDRLLGRDKKKDKQDNE